MITSRAGLTAVRRAAKPSNFFTPTASALLVQAQQPLQIRRTAATQPMTPLDAQSLLAKQRLQRPVAPHLEIYDKKQTYLGSSIWQRFTGMFFTGSLYAYSIGYLVAPLAGWHLESASVAAAFAGLPLLVKGGVKVGLAWPFVYHLINGIKHLWNDSTAKGFRKATIKRTEYIVWGSSTVVALGLAFLL
ncbi:cytochrome b560 subunit of succinate dehydrogenase [Cryphonectria parasitica EP155]|uniref:Cytochrome b560 subunit of succinate dehydrogenase n=1 Tax=Cryphonectria parasitica (strain ATCC 38755 / EP155) TaxID=660469 RepID=A0A9P5CTW6_CRYP1|nr:cytochrome b560 subunit of succinate dehydrogenase [Cryphonectria parasitica EP155]KAF3771079.1 cytochrome b560 subunit of succinate dehydrogenase [Cryphonectria parasitica EP155]